MLMAVAGPVTTTRAQTRHGGGQAERILPVGTDISTIHGAAPRPRVPASPGMWALAASASPGRLCPLL